MVVPFFPPALVLAPLPFRLRLCSLHCFPSFFLFSVHLLTSFTVISTLFCSYYSFGLLRLHHHGVEEECCCLYAVTPPCDPLIARDV